MTIAINGKENNSSIMKNKEFKNKEFKVVCMLNVRKEKKRLEAIAEIKKEASYLKW